MTLTQILQKIKSAFYTKSETDSKLNAKANSSDLNNYFPKSGGQLTDSLISRNVDNSYLTIYGGTNSSKGAHLFLGGNERTTEDKGQFSLTAIDSSSTFHLIGKPDGTLTWGGKSVDTIEEQGDNYIRFSNGIQICWEFHDFNHGAWMHVPFVKPFLYAPAVTATPTDSRIDVTTYVQVRDIDNAGVIFACPYGDCYGTFYTAIGRWK